MYRVNCTASVQVEGIGSNESLCIGPAVRTLYTPFDAMSKMTCQLCFVPSLTFDLSFLTLSLKAFRSPTPYIINIYMTYARHTITVVLSFNRQKNQAQAQGNQHQGSTLRRATKLRNHAKRSRSATCYDKGRNGNRGCCFHRPKCTSWKDDSSSSGTCPPPRGSSSQTCWNSVLNRWKYGFKIAVIKWNDKARTRL